MGCYIYPHRHRTTNRTTEGMKESDIEVMLNRIEQKLSAARNEIYITERQVSFIKRENEEAISYLKKLAKKLKIKLWNPNL